jgi:hypothetical protein
MHDPMLRRRALRTGRERGCWVYIPADELSKAGFDPKGSVPFYRTWGHARGSLMVRLYKEA